MKSSTKKLLKEAFKRGYKKALRESNQKSPEEILTMQVFNVLKRAFHSAQENLGFNGGDEADVIKFVKERGGNFISAGVSLHGLPENNAKHAIEWAVAEFIDYLDENTEGSVTDKFMNYESQEYVIDECTNFIYDIISDYDSRKH